MIGIVDYGMGNLHSVEKALERIGAPARIVSNAADLSRCEKLIVPGVGAFGDTMRELRATGLVEPIRGYIASNRPTLGICLGMQVLFESSEEAPGVAGLGVLSGSVKRFPASDLKVPHMGWNRLTIRPDSRLLTGLPADAFVYFVHSYYVSPTDDSVSAAKADYGPTFTAAVERGNLFGTQFHPEKSQKLGLHILENFVQLEPAGRELAATP